MLPAHVLKEHSVHDATPLAGRPRGLVYVVVFSSTSSDHLRPLLWL